MTVFAGQVVKDLPEEEGMFRDIYSSQCSALVLDWMAVKLRGNTRSRG